MNSYKDLIAYQKAYQLTIEVYKATKNFPREEMYGLCSQMRRAAVSIPSNIAEGYRRGSRKEYVQFLRIALGSCSELETQVSLSSDLDFLSGDKENIVTHLIEDVEKLLTKLIQSLKERYPVP